MTAILIVQNSVVCPMSHAVASLMFRMCMLSLFTWGKISEASVGFDPSVTLILDLFFASLIMQSSKQSLRKLCSQNWCRIDWAFQNKIAYFGFFYWSHLHVGWVFWEGSLTCTQPPTHPQFWSFTWATRLQNDGRIYIQQIPAGKTDCQKQTSQGKLGRNSLWYFKHMVSAFSPGFTVHVAKNDKLKCCK